MIWQRSSSDELPVGQGGEGGGGGWGRLWEGVKEVMIWCKGITISATDLRVVSLLLTIILVRLLSRLGLRKRNEEGN